MAAKKTAPTLSIIVPVFNEERTLLPLLEKVRSVKLLGLRKQILVVNDGSSDGTARLLKKVRIPGGKVLQHPVNRGKGAAIRTAIAHSTGDYVVIQDADLEYDPSDYESLLEPLLSDEKDVVYGSRFLGNWTGFMFWNYLGNKFLTLATVLLFGRKLTDMETCYKVFRGPFLRALTLRSDRFDFEPEVTAKVLKSGVRFGELPITYRGRASKEGKKITWRDGFAALFTLLKYRFMD